METNFGMDFSGLKDTVCCASVRTVISPDMAGFANVFSARFTSESGTVGCCMLVLSATACPSFPASRSSYACVTFCLAASMSTDLYGLP